MGLPPPAPATYSGVKRPYQLPWLIIATSNIKMEHRRAAVDPGTRQVTTAKGTLGQGHEIAKAKAVDRETLFGRCRFTLVSFSAVA